MISVEKYKQILSDNSSTNEEIEEIINSLYQVAELLIDKFVKDKNDIGRKAIGN